MKKVFLILQESGEYSSFSSEPMAIYENYNDACFDIACRIETDKQTNNISNIKGDWYRVYEYKICEMNFNDSNGDAGELQYDKSIDYKNMLQSQKYIEFVEKLTKDNEISLKDAVKKGEERRNEKEVAEAKKRESEVKKFKEMIENDKKFAEDYFKSEAKNNHTPVSLEIINRIGRVAMHTNDRDMLEWVLKNRII